LLTDQSNFSSPVTCDWKFNDESKLGDINWVDKANINNVAEDETHSNSMLKRLFLIFGLLVVSVGGALFYLWYKASYTPSWYSQTSPLPEVSSAPNAQPQVPEWKKLHDKIVESLRKQGNQGKGKIELSADDVNTLVAYGLDDLTLGNSFTNNQNPRQMEQIILGTNTKFQNEKMLIGAMVNFKQLAQQLSSTDSQGSGIAQVLLSLPFIGDRPVYIEMEGKPIAKNGNITLEPNTQVKIAGFSYKLSDLANNLKIPVAVLEDKIINRTIALPMKVETIEVVGDGYDTQQRLVVQGTATKF
jgi:hypothetical protein